MEVKFILWKEYYIIWFHLHLLVYLYCVQRRVGYKCTWVILVLPDFGVPSRTACGLFYVCAAFSCFVILRAILLFIRFAFFAYSFKLPVYRNLVWSWLWRIVAKWDSYHTSRFVPIVAMVSVQCYYCIVRRLSLLLRTFWSVCIVMGGSCPISRYFWILAQFL